MIQVQPSAPDVSQSSSAPSLATDPKHGAHPSSACYLGDGRESYALVHRTRSGAAARKEGSLTLIQVDVVLPLLLVPCAVVSGALEDVSPVPDVMPNGHLL